ncbi:MAG: hypothetical protein ACRD4I_16470, partial [Candidatus Angelobacter sp.]
MIDGSNTLSHPTPAPSTNTSAPASPLPTNVILAAMLQVSPHVSDLIFSPGRPPQVELSGRLAGVKVGTLAMLAAADTQRLALDMIGGNQKTLELLHTQGACDLSYSLPGKSRFRVNI